MSASPFPTQPPPQRAVPTSAPDEFEVLPPEGAGGRRSVAPSDAMSRLIAYLMDNLIKVPGTKNMRVGANPFLDLIPGIGDAAATVIQAAVILEAQRRGVPKAVIARMGANVLVNGLMGMIPGVGEAFAFWFRPTTRNYNLLLRNAPQSGGSGTMPVRRGSWRDWAFVFGVLAVMLIFMGMFIALGMYIIAAILHALFNAR